MRQLPHTKTATAALRKSGKLVLVYVDTDSSEYAADMREIMRSVGFDYPNLYNGSADFRENCLDWNPGGNHYSYLIDPQGNIVARDLYMPELAEVLEHFVNGAQPAPPIGVRATAKADGAGGATVRAELSSPQRLTLRVELDYGYVVLQPDETRQMVQPGGDEPGESREVAFSDANDTVETFQIPAKEGAVEIRYQLRVLIPGTEALCGGKGVWATERGRLKLG